MPSDRVSTQTPDRELIQILKEEAISNGRWSVLQISRESGIGQSNSNLWRSLWVGRPLTSREKLMLVKWINKNLPRAPNKLILPEAYVPCFLSANDDLETAVKSFEIHKIPICVMDGKKLMGLFTRTTMRNSKNKPGKTPLSTLAEDLDPYVKISENAKRETLDSLRRILPHLLIEKGDEIVGTVVPVEDKDVATFFRPEGFDDLGQAYADIDVPRQAADLLIDALEDSKWLERGMKVLDVGTGPLNFPRVLFKRQMKIFGAECIDIVAVEHSTEYHWHTIAQNEVRNLGANRISVEFEGLKKLTGYGNDFDLVVWNFTLPTANGINQLPRILKSHGKVAASFYHRDTIATIDEILQAALASEGEKYNRLAGIYDHTRIQKLMDKKGVQARNKTMVIEHTFKDPRELLEFFLASIAPAGSLFMALPRISEKVKLSATKTIRKRLGVSKIRIPFKLNILLGEKVD